MADTAPPDTGYSGRNAIARAIVSTSTTSTCTCRVRYRYSLSALSVLFQRVRARSGYVRVVLVLRSTYSRVLLQMEVCPSTPQKTGPARSRWPRQ